MRIHSEFFPLKKSAGWVARALNQPNIRDGAYARVGGLQESEVLKATICDATNALFESLLQCTKSGKAVPEALPAVFKRLGPVVRDDEDFKYTVWSVERLFSPGEEVAMRRARIANKSRYERLKPGYLLPGANLTPKRLHSLQRDLEEEQSDERSFCNWEGSADIALAMSLRTEGKLREAFKFLLEFVSTRQVELDLLTQGNIMLNMYGQPCLSDPVCGVGDELPRSKPLQGTCLAAMVPTTVRGATSVTVEPASTKPLPEQELAKLELSLGLMGLEPQRFRWRSAAHRQFLSQGPTVRELRSIPEVTNNLRADRYQQLFCA